MKLLRYFVPIVVAVGLTSVAAYAVDAGDFSRYDNELNERDFDALKEYINTKRTIPLEEKDCNLTISGDVRSEWRHINEKERGERLRGGHAVDADGIRRTRNDFDIEFNLRFDYVCDRAWAVVHLEFDNTAGVTDNDHPCEEDDDIHLTPDPEGYHGSGYCCDLCLKKAYIGYNICCNGCARFDVELGRRNLYNVFDSKIQFLSRFDGILLRYSSCWQCVADWYVNLGGFLVDERANHFAYVGELGFLDIAGCGLDFKYSFIDWRKHGENRCFERNPRGFRFCNSQWTLIYHFNPELLCMPARLFGAFLWNHCAQRSEITDHKKKPYGWYVGFSVGQVVYAGDWAFEAQYQVVEAQAIPDNDVSGIGRGNVNNDSLTADGRGNTNYKGWRVEALYALTDNITFDTIYEYSTDDDSSIGGSHKYSKFELEAIYAF